MKDDSSRGEGPQDQRTTQAEPASAAAAGAQQAAEPGEDDPDRIADILARPALTRCRECDLPLIRPGRDLCAGCEDYLSQQATTDDERRSA